MTPASTNRPVALETGYYLDNFLKILDFVDRLYDDVLTPDAREFSRCFRALPLEACRLYVRLLMRKGPYFRCDKLAYDEIADLPAAVDQLVDAGLAVRNPSDYPEALSALLTRAEVEGLLADHAASLPVSAAAWRKRRKPALLELAANHVETAQRVAWTATRFDWLGLLGGEVLLRYRLLFFGNSRQDWSEFVLLDLGLLRYEPVVLQRNDRLFQSRALLDATVAWLEMRALCDLAMEAEDEAQLASLAAQMPPTLNEAVLRRRRDRLHNRVGAWLERRGALAEALVWYGVSERPPARERRARILDKLKRPRASMALCRLILDGPATEEERLFARSFRIKVAKKLGHTLPPVKRTTFPGRTLNLDRDHEQRIERQVLDHLAGLGTAGFYAENWFWLSLFGLIFWDIVYAPIRGAFFNHYQRGPADLFSESFFESRRALIDDRLAWLRAELPWLPLARLVMRQKWGTTNFLVGWDDTLPDYVALVQERIPGAMLADVFARLVRHPGLYRNGFPDLLLFPATGGFLLGEVKGPGDQLQPNQRGWLNYFLEKGLPLEVIRVIWREAKND